jgi:hypothetical protein
MKKLNNYPTKHLLERRAECIPAFSCADIDRDHAFEVCIEDKSNAVGVVTILLQLDCFFPDVRVVLKSHDLVLSRSCRCLRPVVWLPCCSWTLLLTLSHENVNFADHLLVSYPYY